MTEQTSQKNENPVASLLINVVLPYFILTRGADHLGDNGATKALLIALLLPLTYGVRDYLTRHQTNYVSIFGLVNTLFTGGFALLQLGSTWFIVKEAAFPFLLGVLVFTSSLSNKPVIKYMFNFSHIMNLDKINSRLEERNHGAKYERLLLRTNNWFASSFFLSAVLNFALAFWIFSDIDKNLDEAAKTAQLNQQIADMWWMGYVVIALPLTVFLMVIIYRLIHELKSLTGLELDEILVNEKSQKN